MTDTSMGTGVDVASAFAAAFGRAPSHVSMAPGRVNLIGEHTDYNGLPVFPMALQRATRLTFGPRDDNRVRIRPLAAGYAAREFDLAGEIEPFPAGDWGNYPKAALQALVGRLDRPQGFDAVLTSDVPVAAGLSSSSALVVATALAFLETNELQVPQLELAVDLARGERYVGTLGGGMDQTVSLLSREGSASLIRFNPLDLTPVEVPASWTFVVASSMVAAEKSGNVKAIYNRRTEECAVALDLVNRALEPTGPHGGYRELLAGASAAELLRVGSEVLDPPLMERFRHVVSEGARVEEAVAAMRRDDMVEFGRLMTESHASLRDDYEVSCAELNEMVDIALGSGAVGARLTGAGFGGCIVALADPGRAGDVMDGLSLRFYSRVAGGATAERLFRARPSAGARVFAA